MRYADEAGLASIDTAKTSFHTNAIRLLSDFRDNVVSRSLPGRKFIESYADNGRAWNLFFLSSGGLGLVLLLTWYITRSRRSIRVSGLDSATRQASGKSA